MRGKAPQKVVRGYTAKDHPRLCGEKSRMADATILTKGITPAYAGKSIIVERKNYIM